MKRTIIQKFLVTAMLFLIFAASACTTPKQEPILPSATFLSPAPLETSSPIPGTTRTATLTPTVPPTDTLSEPTVEIKPDILTNTPAPDAEVTWAEDLDIQLRDITFIYEWAWSPTEDELVGFLANEFTDKTLDVVLVRVAGPDFQPQQIRATAPKSLQEMDGCLYPNLLWHPNGQRIFFGGPTVNPEDAGMERCSLWMVEHDGRNPRPYHPEQSGRSLSPFGWLGDHTLLMSGYREGIRLFDLLTGKIVNWAHPSYYASDSIITRDYFVDADGDSGFTQAYALGPRHKPIEMIQTDEMGPMRYALLMPFNDPSCDCYGHTLPFDAFPGTNKVLVYWYGERMINSDPVNFQVGAVHKLVLWDIDQGNISTLVPYAFWGQFSPDNRTLAYLTDGPASLDTENKPVDPFSINQEVEYTLRTDHAYLQLLDFNTGAVYLSVPVASLQNFDDSNLVHAAMNFSPDGRFLSFVTNRIIALNEKGWPDLIQPDSATESSSFLYVLDLKKRRIIFEQSNLTPSPQRTGHSSIIQSFLAHWSPKNDQFIYIDGQNNPILVNLETGIQRPISTCMSGTPMVKWSASGEYVAIELRESGKIGFLRVP